MTFEYLQGIGSRNCEEIESASTASGLTTSGASASGGGMEMLLMSR